MDLQRRITAYHEAAHAVIAFRFRIPIHVVALCDAGPLQGYVAIARPSLISTARRDKSHPIASWPEVVRDTKERAMVFLAGPIAEAKLFGTRLRSHCCESDLRHCYDLCSLLREYGQCLAGERGLRIPEVDVAAMANGLRGRTARILGHFRTWRAVTELARDLEGWSQLTGDEAADTVAWTKRIENQLSLMLPVCKGKDRTRAAVCTHTYRPDAYSVGAPRETSLKQYGQTALYATSHTVLRSQRESSIIEPTFLSRHRRVK